MRGTQQNHVMREQTSDYRQSSKPEAPLYESRADRQTGGWKNQRALGLGATAGTYGHLLFFRQWSLQPRHVQPRMWELATPAVGPSSRQPPTGARQARKQPVHKD